jgi:thioredoxin-dependent peroxiredoxin
MKRMACQMRPFAGPREIRVKFQTQWMNSGWMNRSLAGIERGMKQALSLAIPALALLLAASAPVLRAADVPAEGSKAADFTLQSQEGKTVGLKDFRGQWVVLYFYPKDMTPGCTIEAHNFQRDLDQYKAKKAAIVGISADNIDSHQQFCTKESLTFKLLADPNKEVINSYGSLAPNGMVAARNTFLIDPKGVIRKVYVKVSPNPHSQEVLAALTDLEKGE